MQTDTAVDTSPSIIDIRDTPNASTRGVPPQSSTALPTLAGGLLAFGIAFSIGPRTVNSALSLESTLLDMLGHLGTAALALAVMLLATLATRSILRRR